ncbi:uncharacterized protein MYCFIDRAFT_175611 [Pseudocercospora fijiensis CIRAD86]|uniref:Uncharacterized protein n=1 Tax=Pseudocercospora fijiensis (strain CIRAD86) TaxID=383855 RepID=M3AX62_PSEFD|nr:uncharacterized protein MYCFIDRAFT_175611 [Pseudocercospora fijiensis CIRAD86]EME82062.1 hypothetical protein MYCFIDRAFT_175611 [Pseudocercospora fijiensis CIRAD86]
MSHSSELLQTQVPLVLGEHTQHPSPLPVQNKARYYDYNSRSQSLSSIKAETKTLLNSSSYQGHAKSARRKTIPSVRRLFKKLWRGDSRLMHPIILVDDPLSSSRS